MPEQNNPIQGNFGGVFSTATPNLDRVGQQIMQQYADRQAFLRKESENTDALLTKELSNVRSVDTPQIIDAYNQYKNLKQNQLFNKSLQQNPKAYAKAQMDANAAYANVASMINKSAQYNQFGKQLSQNRLNKPDDYNDDTGDMIATYYATPMDKLNTVNYKGKVLDLTNLDNYRANSNYDFSKLHEAAAGKPEIHYDNGTTDAQGIQTDQHGVKYGNLPSAYRNVYIGGLAANKAGRAATYAWKQHTPEELNQLDQAYQSSPNWQKLGVAPQELPPYNPNDPIGNEATYKAKQYLVGLNPADQPIKTTTNKGALEKVKFDYRLGLEAARQNNREALLKSRHDYKELDQTQQSEVLDKTFGDLIDKAKAGGNFTYTPINGKSYPEYNLTGFTELDKHFAAKDDKGHDVYPNTYRLSADGKTVTPIFFTGQESGTGNRAVVKNLNKPIPVSVFKSVLGKVLYGPKEATKEGRPTTTKKIEIHGF